MEKSKIQKEMLDKLIETYEKQMKSTDYRDVLAFALVLSLINDNKKSPNDVLDRVVHYWVKSVSILSAQYYPSSSGEDN